MKELNIEATKKIMGGFKIKVAIKAASVAAFLIGLLDGFVRPLKCNR